MSDRFIGNASRPVIFDQPRAQSNVIQNTDEVTIVHASGIADLLRAPLGKLFWAAFVVAWGACMAVLATLSLGSLLASLLRLWGLGA